MLTIIYRATADLEAALRLRGGDGTVHIIARREVERLYALYRVELARLRFSADDATLLVAALNGVLLDPATASLLWASVDDYARHRDLDAVALVARLRMLTPSAALAVADAVACYWRAAGDHEARLRAVGLMRSE